MKLLVRNIVCLVFFLSCSFHLSAQVDIDSLWNVFQDENAEDTSRAKSLESMIWTGYQYRQPDSAIYYAKILLDFSKKKGLDESSAWALNCQGMSNQMIGNFDDAKVLFERALELYGKVNNEKAVAGALINIGMCHSRVGEYEESMEYYLKGIELCDKIGADDFKVNALSNIAANLNQQGKYDKSLGYLNEALKIANDNGNDFSVIGICINRGSVFRERGNYQAALDDYLLGLELARENKVIPWEAAALGNIGLCYMEIEEYEEAKSYFNQTADLSLKVGEKSDLAQSYLNSGVCETKLGNYQKAISYYNKSLTLVEEINSRPQIVSVLSNLGDAYVQLNKLDTASLIFQKVLQGAREIDSKEKASIALSNYANVHYKKGEYIEAIKKGEEALELAKEVNGVSLFELASIVLYESYKSVGQPRKALEMYELHVQMRDSILRDENQKVAIKQTYQFEYDKQKKLDNLENEKLVAIEKEKKEKQQTLSVAIAIGLLISLFLSVIIFNRLKIARQQKIIIEEQKVRAEQSEKYKEQFLANMSHEIRTPMHAISGMVKILKRNEHPASQEVYLGAMQTSSDNLLVLLNDVLDMSKIEAGKLDIDKVAMSPLGVIENVINVLQYKAEEKGVLLKQDITENIPSLIIGDPARLNQVLINLTGNAIKFTDKGSVTISLSAERGRLKFSVTDTGIGIPQEKLQSVFGSFEQVKNSHRENTGGTGLGLSISKQLVELMGGEIWAESMEGKGSTFYFSIPLIIAEKGAVGAGLLTEEKLIEMAASLKGVKILLAEDNEFNQMIANDDLTYYIEEVEVDICENGREAVDKYQAGNYDLVLMDVQMPEMDGFEATRKIRELEKEMGSKKTPIIAMTASLLKSEIDNCFTAGMDNYIPKPYKSEELVGTLFSTV